MLLDDPPEVPETCPPHPFLRRRAADVGISRDVADRLLRAGLLLQPMRGILHRADLDDSMELRAAVAHLALPPGAALCRTTAAWFYGVDCRPPGSHDSLPEIECVVPASGSPVTRPGVRCHLATCPGSTSPRSAGSG